MSIIITKLINTWKFIPAQTREELNTLSEESSNSMPDLILNFYSCVLEYLCSCGKSFLLMKPLLLIG